MVGDFLTNENLDNTNYDTYCEKIQFLLNEREVLEDLTASWSPTMAKRVLLVSSTKRT